MQIELSAEEARGLFTLLYFGATVTTLKTLSIYGLMHRMGEEVDPLPGVYFENIATYGG